MDMAEINAIVTDAVRNQLAMDGSDGAELASGSVLLGPDALVDSLGLVNIIIEIEQVLAEQHDLNILLVDEKAMSMRNSPFRTVGSLTDYAHELVTGNGDA
jgi:acyl carrier protein